jgi:uncharacterized membrane protein YesL
VTGLRIIWRGLRDTIEHLLVFIAATLGFWIGTASVIFAPAALLTLFRVTDPRHGIETEKPSVSSTLRYLRAHWGRSWILGFATIPVLALLFYNAVFYSRHSGALSALTPLWLVLFAIALMIALAAFSTCALLDRSVKGSLRLGFLITGKALPRYAIVVAVTAVLTLFGAVMIIPVILFLPASIAAIVNRLILTELSISIADPNAPTPELLAEQKITGKPPRFGGLLHRQR